MRQCKRKSPRIEAQSQIEAIYQSSWEREKLIIDFITWWLLSSRSFSLGLDDFFVHCGRLFGFKSCNLASNGSQPVQRLGNWTLQLARLWIALLVGSPTCEKHKLYTVRCYYYVVFEKSIFEQILSYSGTQPRKIELCYRTWILGEVS